MKLIYNNIIFCVICLFLLISNNTHVFARSLESGKLLIEYDGNGSLFDEINVYPGWQTTKFLSVKNTGRVPHSLSIAVEGSLGSLAEVLLIEPLRDDGTVTWNKSLANVAKSPNSSIILHSIEPGETKQVRLRAKFIESAGNEYQGLSSFGFNFLVGNESTDAREPIILDDTIKLNINRIIEKSVPSESSVVETDNKNVAASEPSATIKGASTDKNDANNQCFWSWLLLIVMAIYLIVYSRIIQKKKHKMAWLLPVVIAILVFCMHFALSSIYEPTNWCDYFIYLLIAELLFYLLAQNLIKRHTIKS